MTAEIADTPIAFERERDNQAWARWLARSIDRTLLLPFIFGVFLLLGAAVEMGRLPYEFIAWADNPLQAAIAEIAAAFLLSALWEPLFLSNTGTTPGKWVMGVRVRRRDGRNIGLLTAIQRFIWVYAAGLGFGIPLVTLICALTARATLISDGVTGWDRGLQIEVTHAKRHIMVWVLAIILVIGTNITVAVLSRMQS